MLLVWVWRMRSRHVPLSAILCVMMCAYCNREGPFVAATVEGLWVCKGGANTIDCDEITLFMNRVHIEFGFEVV